MIGAGAFVAFGDGHEGLLPVRRLRGDWWELNEQGTILVGTRTGGVRAPGRRAHRRGPLDRRAPRPRRPGSGRDPTRDTSSTVTSPTTATVAAASASASRSGG